MSVDNINIITKINKLTMKCTNKYNIDVTKYVIALLENKITSKEFQILINKKESQFEEFDKWFNKLTEKNGTTKY